MEWRNIIEGHVNEVLDNHQDLYEERMKICKECGLYKETMMGPVCNPRLYISIEDKTTISEIPKLGFKRGCGCRLNAACRAKFKKCIVEKW